MRPRLCKKIIEVAIVSYFKDEEELKKLRKAVKEVEKNYPLHTSGKIDRLKIRIKKMEMRRRAVAYVYESIEEEKQRVIFYKYCNITNDVKVAALLSVTVATLVRWRREFIEMLENELFYRIEVDKLIFQQSKLTRMIDDLAEDIEFFSDFKKIIDPSYLEKLKRKRDIFLRVRDATNTVLMGIKSSNERSIIIAKLENPLLEELEIAERVMVSFNLVCTYLIGFRKDVLKVYASRGGEV